MLKQAGTGVVETGGTFTCRSFSVLFLLIILCAIVIIPAAAVPNGTVTLISTDTTGSVQADPAVFRQWVVWDDSRNGIFSNTIYAFNLQTGSEFPVFADPSNPDLWQSSPDIQANWIVWQEDTGTEYRIAAFNNNSNTRVNIPATPRGMFSDYSDPAYRSYNVLPKTNGTTVVWQDYSAGNWDIFLYRLGWTPGTPPEQILNAAAYDERNPAISGTNIVYENWSGGQSDIYLYAGENRTAFRISGSSGDDINPSIDGSIIVWQQHNGITGYDAVYSYDLSTGVTRQVTPAGSAFDQRKPRISKNRVVVQDYRTGGRPEIYLYDLSATPVVEKWLSPGISRYKINPAINGDRIVWEGSRDDMDTDHDIYLMTLGSTAETCPVADFSLSTAVVAQAVDVTFTDTSQPGTGPVLYRQWNFSDGSLDLLTTTPAVTHSFDHDGAFLVTLTVGNQKCRNTSTPLCRHRVFVNAPPIADFNASPDYGLAPLPVTFADISCGEPASWSWDFTDGNTSTARNPVHTFRGIGKVYNVTLIAGNAYGSSSMTKPIRTFMGATGTAYTPVPGITFDNRFSGQFLTYSAFLLPSYAPVPPSAYLVSHPPPAYHWENISFLTQDRVGFFPKSQNATYFANVSRVYLRTGDTRAVTTDSVPSIGTNWGVNYLVNTTVYPRAGSIATRIWEGAVPSDRADFDTIAEESTPPNLIRNIAYTTKITRSQITSDGSGIINMSVGHAWVTTPDTIYVIGFGTDRYGNRAGSLIPAQYRFTWNDLDYFEATIPEGAEYFSTFALGDLDGSGNPFQLITLSVINAGGGDEGGGGAGRDREEVAEKKPVNQTTVVQTTALPGFEGNGTPADKVVSVRLQTMENGTLLAPALLRSFDGLAAVSLNKGITARNSTFHPLRILSIGPAATSDIPETSGPASLHFTGTAYELEPSGAVFYPGIAFTITVPPPETGFRYVLQSRDPITGRWEQLQTRYSAANGTVTATLAHLCYIGLFSQPVREESNGAAGVTPSVSRDSMPAQPPSSAVMIFLSLIAFIISLIVSNILVVVVICIILVLVYALGRKRRMDRTRYKL